MGFSCETESSVFHLTFVGDPLKVCLGLWVLASLGLGAAAAPSAFEGKPIVDIQFSAPQPLDARDLARVQPLKKGQPLRAEDVANAIDGLFATGRFTRHRCRGRGFGERCCDPFRHRRMSSSSETYPLPAS